MANNTKVNVRGVVVVKEATSFLSGKSKVQGPFPGATVSLKKVVDDIEYEAKITEATVMNHKTLQGGVLSVKKNFDNFSAKGVWDLGDNTRSLLVTGAKKLDNNVTVEGSTAWHERNNKVVLGLIAKQGKDKKLTATYNVATQAATAAALYEKDGHILEAVYDFAKQNPTVILGQRVEANTFKLGYQPKDEKAFAQWDRKPYKLIATSAVNKNSKSFGHPTVVLTVERDFDLSLAGKQNPSNKDASRTKAPEGSLVALETKRQGPIEQRLKAIDKSHEKMSTLKDAEVSTEGKKKKRFILF
jgi:hypothetical protein